MLLDRNLTTKPLCSSGTSQSPERERRVCPNPSLTLWALFTFVRNAHISTTACRDLVPARF
jgi:hypothetical protein